MYKLITDRFEHTAGTVVYPCNGYDYGLSRDDTMITGVEHVSVTTDPTGGYPFFTVPVDDLERIVN